MNNFLIFNKKTRKFQSMKKTLFLLLFISQLALAQTQQKESPNLIIITTDGLRWQEVFSGVDKEILYSKLVNRGDSTQIAKKYVSSDPQESRKKLMPFLWSTVNKEGMIFGNRNLNSLVDVANPYWFSYPGYSELLTGHVDTLINSNDYKPNPNTNLFAFLNKQNAYKGKVAAFGAWDAFNRILNEEKSGFPVINAFEPLNAILKDDLSNQMSAMLKDSYKPFKEVECLDVFTHYQALHYLKSQKPKGLYISYGETDEWAHHGQYSDYLDAAHQVDQWIKDIWTWVQNTPGYKDNTYVLIATDHGRGWKNEWTSHGSKIKDANFVWFALMGPNLNAKGNLGEQKGGNKVFQKELAATILSLIGQDFKVEHEVGKSILKSGN